MAPAIDDELVRRLVTAQFPQWSGLPVRSVETAGWDNSSFHLGERMIVRLPRTAAYAAQVEKEQRWLPKLAPLLPLQIPTPLAMGEPANGYPWKWSVYRWIDGQTAKFERISDLTTLRSSLPNSSSLSNASTRPAGRIQEPITSTAVAYSRPMMLKQGAQSPFSKARSILKRPPRFGTWP